MEALGQGLASIGSAIGIIGVFATLTCITGIVATTFLIYEDKITFEQLKQLFNKNRRY